MRRSALPLVLLATALAVAPAHAGNRKLVRRGTRRQPSGALDVAGLGTGWGHPQPVDVAEGKRLGGILYKVAERPALRKDGSIDLAELGKPFHTRPHLDVENASAVVYSPAELAARLEQLGLPRELMEHPAMSPGNNPVFTPGRRFEGVWFRYSAAPGDRHQKDGKGGFHGVAIRLFADPRAGAEGGIHDLLLTNANPAHISNEHEQVAFADGLSRVTEGVKGGVRGAREAGGAVVGGILRREAPAGGRGAALREGLVEGARGAGSVGAGLAELVKGLGPIGTFKTFATLAAQGRRPVDSIFTTVYHGRTPNQFGVNAEGKPVAVKYRLVPLESRVAVDENGQPFAGEGRLKQEGAAHLAQGDVEVELQLQYYVGSTTPIDDARVEWKSSPFIPFMKLRIPAQDVRAAEARGEWSAVEEAGFNPGHVLAEGYLPVGPGALRPVVYDEVQRLRHATEQREAARGAAAR